MKIKLMVAVNDYRNGAFTGEVDHVELWDGDVLMDLERCGWPLRFQRFDGGCKIGHLRFGVLGYRPWIGNWCWDCAIVKMEDAARIVDYLRRHRWDCMEAEAGLFEKYRQGAEITVADLEVAS